VLIVVLLTTLGECKSVDFLVVFSMAPIYFMVRCCGLTQYYFAFCFFVWLSQGGFTFAQGAAYLHIYFSDFQILNLGITFQHKRVTPWRRCLD
jgi:hypothetical protein